MTILQALAARHERLAERGEAPVPGFGPVNLGFAVVLGTDGRVVTVDDLRVGDGKRARPQVREAPLPPKRTVAVASGAFWDKTSYVFGRTAGDPTASPERQARDAARTAQEHAAFKLRHESLLAGTEDAGCHALLAFLRSWTPDAYDALLHAGAMLDQNVAFRLDGEPGFIHERPAARAALLAEAGAAAGGTPGVCLVTGAVAPIARLHPSIKGVSGAQSSGAALVSFNLDAFNSYGKEQGGNAPVSEAATFAYATALNALLSASDGADPKTGRPRWRNRVGLGEDTVVFWAETAEAERVVEAFFDVPPDDEDETTAVRKVLQDMQAGRGLQDAGPKVQPGTRVYVLGLSPNAARLSVRFWVDQTLGDLAARFQEHWDDLRLDPAPRSRPPPVWALLSELAAQRKAENVPAHLAGELTRAILTGGRYPSSLLAQTVMRIRADQDRKDAAGRTQEKLSALRVAMLKACLARDHRKGLIPESVPVSLDPDSTNPAYRLGRLFAVLERLQRAGLGERNATIRDRFYAAASATPEMVFPSLLRNARNHGKAVRSKVGAGLAEWFEDRIGEIAAGLDGAFPKVLTLQEQGRFALGYYHQREFFRRKKDGVPPELDAAEQAVDETDQE